MIAQLDIREHEESAKKALLLKRKELRWKLMEASQLRNRAKLEEIRLEADYNKKKVAKILALANKLRAKYMKVAKAAKIAESHYKKVELKLLTQEKFVADETMQLTKLAVDCRKLGSQIFGNDYCRNTDKHYMYKKLKLPIQTRLSSLYDLKDSFLRNLASYRLTTKFPDTGIPITDLSYTHNICPSEYICLPDLVGSCSDRDCVYQHKSSYLMTDLDKLADILSYRPSLTGFKPEPELDRDENEYRCRIKLKQYSAKLLVKNSDKPVEVIAQNLVKYVRGNKSDHELLTMIRELPKVTHLVCVTPSDASPKESEEFKEPVVGNDVIANDDEVIIKIDD